MHLHLTTSTNVREAYEALRETQHKSTLLSFHYKAAQPRYEEYAWSQDGARVLLDSGAFTAWSLGKQIDLQRYAEWALGVVAKWGDHLVQLDAVNLDRIPGEKGRDATRAELQAAMRESIANADQLRAAGLRIVEVFHQDEPLEFLDELLHRLPPRSILALSPRNDVAVSERVKWLRGTVLPHLLTRYAPSDLPRMHGLAATAKAVMSGFPFYSVDSASWIVGMRYGHSALAGVERLPRLREDGARGVVRLALRGKVRHYQHLALQATRLWAARGVVWEDE